MADNDSMNESPPAALPPQSLHRRCDASKLGFTTTAELRAKVNAVGQKRAAKAIEFGLSIRRAGYNLFVIGPQGIGKRTLIDRLTRERAASEPIPRDWVYVHNFVDAHKPNAISLPSGRGAGLRKDMQTLIDDLRVALPAAFDSDNYRSRRQAIEARFKEHQEAAFHEVERHAKERGVAIVRMPFGIALAPMKNGEVMDPGEFKALPETERKALQHEMNEINTELEEVTNQMPHWESERRDAVRELNQQVVKSAVGFRLDAVKARYSDSADVVEYLGQVTDDLIENAEQFFVSPAAEGMGEVAAQLRRFQSASLDRYQVNLLVDHRPGGGAPVVEENNPTLQNLIGRVEYRQNFGNLVADFTLIKPGALHMANGGYLILDGRRVLLQPFAWEELKRVLRSGQIEIRSVADTLGLVSTATLQPESIPLAVKVVLTGDLFLYHMLSELDPDFRELFKIAAEFDGELSREGDGEMNYASLLAAVARDEEMLPVESGGIARLIEQSARLAGDAGKMTANIEAVADLMREADHIARESREGVISAAAVQKSIDRQMDRVSRLRNRVLEEIHRGTILIDVSGEETGQINGLSVLEVGGFAFGRPTRITARTSFGRGQVVDIEREVKLGGPLHSKGVYILAGFLRGRFGADRPISLSASLAFEQSYGGVEGDSASMAELCALLSSLAQVPIRQSLAITGSVNQNGEAQAVGGVNEKIEGFFDVCRNAGLTGRQGVIIPSANVKHLMLRHDVVEAVASGLFRIFTMRNVDDAMFLLTGMEAGTPGADGFRKGSLNEKIDLKLKALAERAREQSGSGYRGTEL